ncbi:MAG: ABC transporter permease [Planctomycetes bacterium]|nr:ABC transporter permease [Planctomycetota bacterium]
MLGVKNLQRNFLRTGLTAGAIAVLGLMITIIWTIIYFIDLITVERSKDLKIIVTYKWSVPSQLPMPDADYLDPSSKKFLPELTENGKPLYGSKDFMIWSFYGGTTDPAKITPDTLIFFFVMNPEQIIPMMDDMQDLDPKLVEALSDEKKPYACLLGVDKLKALNKKVGERFKLTSVNYKGIDLAFEIVGVFPDGRYNASAIMRMDYFNRAFDLYKQKNNNATHPLADKRLNLIWIRVGDRAMFDRVGSAIEGSKMFSREVKCETASSLIGSFLEAYRDIIWGMKFLLVPGMMVVMALVMANAISITVRERRTEMAVMKVLGFTPNQIFFLILGEAMLVGALAGLLSAGGTFLFFNLKWGGIPFRIGFFPVFRIPESAWMWGLAIGSLTAFIGAAIPAWSAREVKVSEVFSKVA